MIKSFKDKESEKLFVTGKSAKIPNQIINGALRKLDYLNAANDINDLRVPPANRLEALKGNLIGKHNIRINDQYRIVFEFRNADVYEVEIIDYH